MAAGTFAPTVWEEFKVRVFWKGGLIAEETLPPYDCHALPLADPIYQSEREANERMRLSTSLRKRLEEIMQRFGNIEAEQFASDYERTEPINNISRIITDLRLAVQIQDFFAEEELLLQEGRAVARSFQPPDTGETVI
jgi:hypothetical protein